jgi:hypothetical protein
MSAFLLLLGLAILIIVAAATFLARSRESRALRDLAARSRLNFTAEDLIDLHGRYYRLDCIRRGHNHFAWNLLYGTTEEGLVSLFCYRCDLGFGVNQISRTSWIAVAETPRELSAWSAEHLAGTPAPPTPTNSRTDTRPEICVGPFIVRADAEETIARLRQAGLDSFLAGQPAIEHAQACRQLIAVAIPYDRDPQTPARLLDTLHNLARLLESART